jgi:hypothetical protein
MCAESLTCSQKEFFRRPRLSQTELADRPATGLRGRTENTHTRLRLQIFCSPLTALSTGNPRLRLATTRRAIDVRHPAWTGLADRQARQAHSLPRAPIGHSRRLATMAENDWIPLSTAAALVEDNNWLKQIRRALVLGVVTARGVVPPGTRSDIRPEGELVEITAHEFANLRIDFLGSHLVHIDRARWRVTVYAAVEVRRADVERLARGRGEDEIDADIPAQSRSSPSAPVPTGSETGSADADAMPGRLWNDWDQPHLSLNLALSWIAFRNAGGPRSREERMSALFTALTYRKGDGVIDGNPVRSLMLALRLGDPIAFDENGKALSPEFWAHRGFDERKWPPIVFRRKDMLRLWPDVETLGKDDGSPKGALSTGAKAPEAYADAPYDKLVSFYRAQFGAPGAATNADDMDRAAENNFGGRIRVKARRAARNEAGVKGRVGRPRKSGK